MKLSVLMPAFNEAETVVAAVERVLKVPYPCPVEVIVVDDGSTDGTTELLRELDDPALTVLHHESNRGKGAAVRTGASRATGDYIVVCDADLEYAPEEIPQLLTPILEEASEVVYGSRSFGSHTAYSFWYVVGNKAVTMFANVLYNVWISDLETCFKVLPLSLYRSLDVRARGFGMEAELTAKLLRLGYRPFEVPIGYTARTREAGKKLTWRDGVHALWILTKVRVRRMPAGVRRERPR